MEDKIEIADRMYPKGVVIAMGNKLGHVALHIQDGDQHQNAFNQSWTDVAIPHDQMLR